MSKPSDAGCAALVLTGQVMNESSSMDLVPVGRSDRQVNPALEDHHISEVGTIDV